MDRRGEVTRALNELGAGSRAAAEHVLPPIYDELRALAAAHLKQERHGHTLQATALVHEAWLRLAGIDAGAGRDRARFFALCARAIRRVLVDHARARDAKKRGGEMDRITLTEDVVITDEREVDLLALDEALARLSLLDPRQAQVVELRFFGGLTVEETARELEVSERTVEGDWHMARGFLHRELVKGASR